MRAVVIRQPGGPEVLEVRDVPRPEPGPGEVRVRVRASGINRADLLQRRGGYPAPPGAPDHIPGLEYAGTVEAMGPDVHGVEPGARVMGLVGGGGYAEHVVVHERTVVPIPPALTLEDAGAVPEVFMTAFDALFLQMELAAGETLLVHAAGSGVGTAAIQLARAAGATTLGTSRTPEKLERARELGLDRGFEGGGRPWHEEVLEATAGRGVDVILDLVGAPYAAGNLGALAPRGRWIVVGVPGGTRTELDLRALMSKRASVTGTLLRARPLEEKGVLAQEFGRRVVPLLQNGRVRPVLDRTFPPESAAEAHALVESNRTFGTVVLLWD